MFKKIAAFTDLHTGLKSNSTIHNQDCEDFIDWFIETAKAENCDTGIFLGDWNHNRNNINMVTLQTSLKCLEKLGKEFDNFYFFPGNHDLYHKEKRSVHSAEWASHIPGITIVNDITTIGNTTLVPWLVGEEWKKMSKIKSKYVFGHFELPLFMMNAMVQMPDHGNLQATHFSNPDYVFSGHFHKRQSKENIVYIGNAFPHNYADANDDDRGMMILEYDKKPEFRNWVDCPKYRVIKLSELIDNADNILSSKMHLRVNIDIPISFEESSFIKETFMSQYDIRELVLIPERKSFDSDDSIDSTTFNSTTLLEIYNNL